MNTPYVSSQMNFLHKSFSTFCTLEWPFSSVGSLMIPEIDPFSKLFLTVFADKLAFTFVQGNMILKILFAVKALTTNGTQMRPLSCVCSDVLLHLLSF